MTTPMESGITQALAGCIVSLTQNIAGDSGYTNPDGNHVDAPQGTVFVELELSPAEARPDYDNQLLTVSLGDFNHDKTALKASIIYNNV